MNNVFDLHHQIERRVALIIGQITTDTTTLGIIIDTAGFTALEFIILIGFVTDGNYAVGLQHGDDAGLSDAVAVPSDEILGNADFDEFDDNKTRRIGYLGKKRYVRLSIVSTGIALFESATLGAMVDLGGSNHQPIVD
jgi:hypothetical protein